MLWTLKDVNAIVILRKFNEKHKSKTIEMKHNVMRFFYRELILYVTYNLMLYMYVLQ